MKHLKLLITGLSFALFLSFVAPSFVHASAADTISSGVSNAAGEAGLQDGSIEGTVANIVGNLLSMIGILFFVLMLYGGILWMTARGDTDQTQKAMNTLIAATVGIVIVLASYAITNFVLDSLGTGPSSTSSNNNSAANNNNPVTSCSQRSNAQCMNIKKCAGVSGNTEKELKDACDKSNWCQRGLCSGDWKNVCCSKSK